MTWTKALMVGSFFVAMASVWACGSDPAPEDVCPKDDPTTEIDESECRAVATLEGGNQAVTKRQCMSCHGPDMAGKTDPLTGKPEYDKNLQGLPVKLYPPNLTNDPETGIGNWADEEVVVAIREGFDKESLQLCPQMQHYKNMSDFEAYSIVMYLRSLPVVSKKIPRSVCPPTKVQE